MGSTIRLIIGAFLAAFAWPSSAFACRMEIPKDLQNYSQVVVVSVSQSEPVPNPGFNIWRLSATLKRTVRGIPKKNFEFQAVLGSNGCSNPRPRRGGLWVLYLSDDHPNDPEQAYPLAYVRPYDPRLGAVAP